MLDRGTGNTETANHCDRGTACIGSDADDCAAAVLCHVPRGRGSRHKPCLQSRSHGLGEAFMSHVHERLTLCVTPVDGVEHEPHRPGFFGDGREVRLNCITIQRVYSCHLSLAPVGLDFRSNCLELPCGSTGKEYVCSFPGESLGDGTSNGS